MDPVHHPLLLLLSLACAFMASKPAAESGQPEAGQSETEQSETGEPEQVEPEDVQSDTTPETDPAAISVDNIDVAYAYTENLTTAFYHLYGTVLSDFVDITITNRNDVPVTVMVKSEVSDYTSPSSDTVIVQPGDSFEIHQNPILNADAVEKLNSQKPANFHIRLDALVNGEQRVILDETKQILVFSRRDYTFVEGFNEQENLNLLAVWITPNDPGVEALIRAAAEYIPGGIMTSGYGGEEHDSEKRVLQRLEAIWEAEKNDYGLTYISTMTTFAPGAIQRMRLPAEVLEQHSGNCIELVNLYASAAEALRLEPAIVLLPGHAFLAIRSDVVNADYYFIETTLIGQDSFNDALALANKEIEEVMPHIEAGDSGYGWVTVPEARKMGILPVPWR